MYFDNTGGVDLSFLRPSESLNEDEFWADHSYLVEKDTVITIQVLIATCEGQLVSKDHVSFSFKPLDCSGDLDLLISMLCGQSNLPMKTPDGHFLKYSLALNQTYEVLDLDAIEDGDQLLLKQ